MLKQIVKETVKILIDRPRIIRLALLTSYSYTFYQIYWIIYFVNWLINIQYNSWFDVSDALIYFVNAIQKFNILWLIITIAIIFLIWISIFWPIWRQALIYSIDDENMRSWTAFIKWRKKWGIMAEFWWVNMWWLSMRSVFIFIVRFRMLWYLNNPVIITVFIIWIACVLGKIVFWPYVNYYIVLKDYSARDAVIKSMNLTFSNLWLTFKGLLRQTIIRCKFLFNSCLAIWIPLLIMIFCIQMNIIDYSVVEIIARILVSIWLLIFIYLEAVFKAFDNTYRYKIFIEAERRNNLK
jgi:hypothetical protein